MFLHVGSKVIAALLVEDTTGGQILLIKQLWALHLRSEGQPSLSTAPRRTDLIAWCKASRNSVPPSTPSRG